MSRRPVHPGKWSPRLGSGNLADARKRQSCLDAAGSSRVTGCGAPRPPRRTHGSSRNRCAVPAGEATPYTCAPFEPPGPSFFDRSRVGQATSIRPARGQEITRQKISCVRRSAGRAAGFEGRHPVAARLMEAGHRLPREGRIEMPIPPVRFPWGNRSGRPSTIPGAP